MAGNKSIYQCLLPNLLWLWKAFHFSTFGNPSLRLTSPALRVHSPRLKFRLYAVSQANQNELKASKVEQDCRRKETELTALRAAAAQQDTELKQKAQLLETTQKEVKILEGQLQELQMECRTAKQSAVQKEEIVRKMQVSLGGLQ